MELGNNNQIYSVLQNTLMFVEFSSPDYRLLIAIVNEMNINDFGVIKVKNKIKNLRSTCKFFNSWL